MNASALFMNVEEAHERIRPYIHRTPVLTCTAIEKRVGAALFFKCENFQKVGAFKFRGACNTVFALTDEAASRGVVTHSSGNHAAALSLAARTRGIPAFIVMPSNAPQVKVDAVKGYGGEITFCEPTLEARESTAEKVIEETGATLVHPYNDDGIIAGQATAAKELIEDAGELDLILAPVSGGGLLSGTAISAKAMLQGCAVIGCEPKNADDAYRSKEAGRIIPVENPNTIADGLRTSLGDRTFPIVRDLVDDIVLATDQEIIAAMRLIFERMKIVVEPSGAITLAVLLAKKVDVSGKRAGVIFSGGNVDLRRYFEEMERGLNG